jgi:nitroreductase
MINLLRSRRSIRKYQHKSIEDGHLETLKEALLRCPSSRGINPWRFVFVDDPDLLAGLSKAKEHGSSFVKDAALSIVVCGDETSSDVWIEDCSIASVVAHLTAHSLGLGSCWIQIRNRPHCKEQMAGAYIRELLGIPSHLKVEAIVAIGYPAENPPAVPKEKLDYRKILTNRFETDRRR